MSEFELAGEFLELASKTQEGGRLISEAVNSLMRSSRAGTVRDFHIRRPAIDTGVSRLIEGSAEPPQSYEYSGQLVFPSFSREGTSYPVVVNSSVPSDSPAAKAWRRASRAAVNIEGRFYDPKTGNPSEYGGSGFLLNKNLVATANHVIADRFILPHLDVFFGDGTARTATLAARDEAADIALLKLRRPLDDDFEALPLASDMLSVHGDRSLLSQSLLLEDAPVGIYGYPDNSTKMTASLGGVKTHLDGKYYPESLAPFHKELIGDDSLRKQFMISKVHCTASGMDGYSGAPVLRWSDGKVIGILTNGDDNFCDHKLGAKIFTSWSTSAATIDVLQRSLKAVERGIGAPLPDGCWLDVQSLTRLETYGQSTRFISGLVDLKVVDGLHAKLASCA